MLFLKNIAKEANSKKVRELLLGPLELDDKSVSDIVRITSWAEITGMYEACAAFLKLYNKGTQPKDKVKEKLEEHQKFIQKDTYFGMLLEPIYNVIYQYEHQAEVAREQNKQSFEDLMKEISSMA